MHLLPIAAAFSLAASTALAATLSVIPAPPSGNPDTLPSSNGTHSGFGLLQANNAPADLNDLDDALFKDDNGIKQIVPGVTEVTTLSNGDAAGKGLYQTGNSVVRVTYLGREAGFTNVSMSGPNGQTLDTNADFGDYFEYYFAPTSASELVPFSFFSSGSVQQNGSIRFIAQNGGPVDSDLRLSFTNTFNNGHSVIAFFEDIGQNQLDLDDMLVRIDVAPVPLPTSALLLGAGLLGLGALRSRKS